ncbi:helix-turn-helix domain-containing protein [Streptomyces sp. ODS28]|uniref:PucR family transcriptional regulator n=1 Tax=Streptomyces sp. ODS28 TaxID=3136688 RepID=UPI0031EC778D
MEALVVRLSQLDTQVEGALRVVMFYDTLMRRRVDLPALARASAGLAECVAGIRLHGTGWSTRMAPDGRQSQAPPAPASSTAPVTLDDEEAGVVWLERADTPPRSLDQLLLERLALAAAAVLERYEPARTSLADPALVELAISGEADEAARARALRLLGFAAEVPLHVIAVRPPAPSANGTTQATTGNAPTASLGEIGALVCPSRGPVKAAPLATEGVILAPAVQRERFPAGVRAGVGAATSPDRSWQQARTALRFTTAHRPVLEHADLGALALLTEIPEETARENPDVAAIARLARSPEEVETLEAYCATGSLRRAADLLHLHHSSVSRRLEQIGRTLGFDLTEPSGVLRAQLGLTAWRLLTAD